ncbi:MAG TPA: hypothetical protein DCL54_18365 [Alphaproteobacteria bacterium]|nr:hypothetical protein [Alphaproteobacteria bacterium]HAJ48546.1 hypothetical protein [Alphaproteobacteria bacterium]
MDSDRTDDLKRLLGALTPEKAAELAMRLEADKLKANNPQADQVLSAIRHLLRQARPPRWRTPLRLFCQPFAPLLTGERARKQPGRIARASIAPVWAWLAKDLIPEDFAALTTALTQAILDRDEAKTDQLKQHMHHRAGKAIASALDAMPEGSPERLRLHMQLGGEDVLSDAAEIALILSGADEMLALQAILPDAIPALEEALISRFREFYDHAVQTHPALAPHFVVAVMNRLGKPWEVMRLVRVVSRRTQDTLISASDLGLAGDLLMDDMEDLANEIKAAPAAPGDPKMLAAKIERLQAMSAGFARELGIKRDGRWGTRLVKLRASAAHGATALLDRAPLEVTAPFALQRFGAYMKAPRKPDLQRLPDGDKVQRAVRWAAIVAALESEAQNMGYLSAHKAAKTAIDDHLIPYVEALLSALRLGEGNERSAAAQSLGVMAQVVRSLNGDAEADLLQRRIAAAQKAA